MTFQRSPHLQPGERVIAASPYPSLIRHQPGSQTRPVLVLVPGGGHLARIFYGHAAAEPKDFLMHWLGALGYEVLAVSYPSDHPAISAACTDMTITTWAQSVAGAVAAVAGPARTNREVVLVGWSMAGRLPRAFAHSLMAWNLHTSCFVGLAATAPLLNLIAADSALTPNRFWDSATRRSQWQAEVMRRKSANGGAPISAADYEQYYRCDNAIAMRAEPTTAGEVATVLQDLGTFDYGAYPLCAGIVPNDTSDARHALTDRATWSFLNAQKIYGDIHTRAQRRLQDLQPHEWSALRRRITSLSRRLFREIDGGHFFFVGRHGARRTADLIHKLIDEAAQFTLWRDRLLNIPR